MHGAASSRSVRGRAVAGTWAVPLWGGVRSGGQQQQSHSVTHKSRVWCVNCDYITDSHISHYCGVCHPLLNHFLNPGWPEYQWWDNPDSQVNTEYQGAVTVRSSVASGHCLTLQDKTRNYKTWIAAQDLPSFSSVSSILYFLWVLCMKFWQTSFIQ